MPELKRKEIETYLCGVLHTPVTVLRLSVLGGDGGHDPLKGYGYGVPVKVDFQCDGVMRTAVLHTMSPGPFGHEHMADRAGELIWENRAFNRLPRHVPSLDVGGFVADGRIVSAGAKIGRAHV